MKKKFLLFALAFILSTSTTYGYEMISEKDERIIQRAVNKISDNTRAESYIEKLISIEKRVRPEKISTYDFLLYSIKDRANTIIEEKELIEKWRQNNDILPYNHPDIPKEYYGLANRAWKIVRINKNYEFWDNDGKRKRVLPNLYIEMEDNPGYIRTVDRTYNLENEIMMIEWRNVYFSVWGYTIEEEVNLNYIKKNAGKYITFSQWLWRNGLWIAVSKINNIDYVLDTTSYEYSHIPNKPFYLSSYTNLHSVSDWMVANIQPATLTLFTENAHFYRLPFYVNKNLVNRDKNIAFLGADLLHYSKDRQSALTDWMAWQKLVFFTNDLIKWAKTDKEKIDVIYRWITTNIKYNQQVYDYFVENGVDLSTTSLWDNDEAFWWLKTFENRLWVCQGIARLFYYMLSIAWVKDAEVIDGKANNGEVYIEHSWLKINGLYYDPTFDLWGWTKNRPYMYKWLPQDIMYASRDYKDTYDWAKADWDQLKEKYYNELSSVYKNYKMLWKDGLYPIFEWELNYLKK